MKITFQKLYRYDRLKEHSYVAVPFGKGQLTDESRVHIFQKGKSLPVQTKVTSRYEDGSIRYLFLRFMADLPANRGTELELVPEGNHVGSEEGKIRRNAGTEDSKVLCDAGTEDCKVKSDAGSEGRKFQEAEPLPYTPLQVIATGNGFVVKAGVEFQVSNGAASLFDYLDDGNRRYTAKQFAGPILTDGKGGSYGVRLGEWSAVETGPLCAVLKCMGQCEDSGVTFESKLTAYAEKPWVEISYRIINSTDEPLKLASLVFAVLAEENSLYQPGLSGECLRGRTDSTGCSDLQGTELTGDNIYLTTGIKELDGIQQTIGTDTVRTCVGSSNYKTNFAIGRDGTAVNRLVDDRYLLAEANEHFAEVFYGTFFADRNDARGGVCATVYQAQQNYPKAVKADDSGVYVMLVPECDNSVVMESGMSREQRFLLHFHPAEEKLLELDNRSLIYQMPDKPSIPSSVFREAGVMPDIFVEEGQLNYEVELSLIAKCDNHARCYGMLNWGDAPDPGYTSQGRGKGLPVWTNNEYDFPHACALLYARTGERRFLDYMITACSHWMDVDVCHYSSNPLHIGGQWEHTRGHCKDGVMVCSHEWVEGLLDCYHFTGDERAFQTALGIGENVRRLLDTPMYQTSGESNARETGWALRTLTALYVETGDDKWLEKCEWILGHFREWTEEYGEWVAPYTDNTTIRVGFMISVAVGSIMRYYRIFPREEIRKLMLDAIDDLVDNCLMDNGMFYYKELPSLNRIGNNTLLLEALTIGYELTGDTRYLEYGKGTFWASIRTSSASAGAAKTIVEDAVITKGPGTKNFAQCFIPLSVYYKAMADNHML